MKFGILKTFLAFIVFFLFVAAGILAVKPVYDGFGNFMREKEREVLGKAEEQYRLKLRYESLSPSIFRKIHINSLSVSDLDSGEELFSVQQVSLSYSLWLLLHRDFDSVLTELSVYNVNLNLNSLRLQKLLENFNFREKEKKSLEETVDSVFDTVRKVAFNVPFSIKVKKVNLNYETDGNRFILSIREISSEKDSGSSCLNVSATGYFLAELNALKGKSAGVFFNARFNLPDSVSGASLQFVLDDYSKADYSLSRTGFLLNYSDKTLFARSIQRFFPYEIYLSFNVGTLDAAAKLKMQDFDPLRLARFPASKKTMALLKGFSVSTDTDFSFNLDTKKVFWKSTTDLSVFNSVVKQLAAKTPQKISFEASGDFKDVSVKRLDASGGFAGLHFQGTMNIPRIQPEGILSVKNYTFLNGNKISGDLHLTPLKSGGFNCVIPELRFADYQTFSDVRIFWLITPTSIEASLSGKDLSRPEFGSPGLIEASGIMALGKRMQLQATANLQNFFVQSGLNVADFFIPEGIKKTMTRLNEFSHPYISNIEGYFSTDFKDFNYNSPVALFANTTKDREILLVSFDGSNSSVQFSNIDLMAGTNSLEASGGIDFLGKEKQVSFTTDFLLNSIPYSVNGIYSAKKWLSLNGDYGVEVYADFSSDINGTLRFTEIPVYLKNMDCTLTLSMDSAFSILDRHTWNMDIMRLELADISGGFMMRPRIAVSGSVNQTGMVLSEISYTDNASVMNGSGNSFWNFSDGLFDSALLSFSLKNPVSEEKISFEGNVANPLHRGFSMDTLRKDFFFSASADIAALPVSRFLPGQAQDNTITASVAATGTFENPYFTFDLKHSSIFINGDNLVSKFTASCIDSIVSIDDASIVWKNFSVKKIASSFNVSDFSGDINILFDFTMNERHADLGVDFSVSNLSDKKYLMVPDTYSVASRVSFVSSNFIKKFDTVSFTVIRSPGRFDLISDEVLGAYGELLDDGSLSLAVSDSKPFHFSIAGFYRDQNVEFDAKNVYLDFSKVAYLFSSENFRLYKGVLDGDLHVSGYITDPDLDGNFSVHNIDFTVPSYIPDHFVTQKLEIDISHEEIVVPKTRFFMKDNVLFVSAFAELDRAAIRLVQCEIETAPGRYIPVDAKFDRYRLMGKVSVDSTLKFEDGVLDIEGRVGLNNAHASMQIIDFTEKKQGAPMPFDCLVNLDIDLGKKVQVEISPLLRSLVTHADSNPINITVDTASEAWTVTGNLMLRGGEISYLNRNFYLKEGLISLNENERSTDPFVTVRAETRERDMEGESVTISLSAVHQRVSNFHAVLSAIPARSENEILEMLGQIVRGDTSSVEGLLVAGMDYGVNVTVLRKLEGTLRDLFNFDIFSVRTTVLQNTLMQSLKIGRDSDKPQFASNLFDNTTVYIGKYFGDDIYADALLHWTYDKVRSDSASVNALVFRPEIGLELNAPFAKIRWSYAPDLSEFQQSWAQAASVSLSWRISF